LVLGMASERQRERQRQDFGGEDCWEDDLLGEGLAEEILGSLWFYNMETNLLKSR